MMVTRILIVDDDPETAQLIELTLRKFMDDFVIYPAIDGEAAIANVELLMDVGIRPDITIMDLRMPHMDGIECTKELTERGIENIHILSAFLTPDMIASADEAGAIAIMDKGEGYTHIATKIADFLRGK
jgi:CheY-like chemotaxis protein